MSGLSSVYSCEIHHYPYMKKTCSAGLLRTHHSAVCLGSGNTDLRKDSIYTEQTSRELSAVLVQVYRFFQPYDIVFN